jgi:hypothetical protein
MTAINIIRQSEVIHVISDGAFCDPNGVLCELVPNTWLIPHLLAAIGIHGSPHFMPFLVNRLGRESRSFDDMMDKIIPIAIDVHTSFPMTHGTLEWGAVAPEFDLLAAGWSKVRGRPVSYLIARPEGRHGAAHNSRGIWDVIELPDALIAPPITERMIATVGWKLPESAQAFQPEIDGLKLLNAQRLSRLPINPKDPEGGDGFMVGGFAQLTSISERGISSRILHRWPDKIGRKIDPRQNA